MQAQSLSAYFDYKNYFFVFDNGQSKEMEYMPVKWYKTGKNAVAYVDNTGNFKGYYNGQTTQLMDVAPANCIPADDFIVYYSTKMLQVFDRGNSVLLSGWTTDYVVGDSITGFFDEKYNTYKIYYRGEVLPLPNAAGEQIKVVCAGDNLLAYKGSNDFLKIYYNNQVFNLEINQISNCRAAANTVAFMDESEQVFKVFYKGSLITLEKFTPQSFIVGDDMVAYVDNNSSLKVFYQDRIIQLSPFVPQLYKVSDNIFIYADDINFNVFYKGDSYTLEKYIPKDYQIDLSTLAYIDREGYLNAFYNGKTKRVHNEKPVSYELSGNTIKFVTSVSNEIHFFMNGRVY